MRRTGIYRQLLLGASFGAALLSLFLFAACSPPPLKLALVAVQSGRNSVPGVATRNGALIAVAELAAAGRRIELRVEDDGNDPARAEGIDRALFAEGYRIIIGHDTSEVTLAAKRASDELGFVLLSPTSNSALLADGRDRFFMLLPTARREGAALGARASAQASARGSGGLGLKRAATVVDLDNEAFTRDFAEGFAEAFAAGGGAVACTESFVSGGSGDFAALAARIVAQGPDIVALGAGVLDTAILSQQLRMAGFRGRLALSDWALEPELAANGGGAVLGSLFAYPFDPADPGERVRDFRKRYRFQYDEEPNFSAWLGYEAVMVLAAAAAGGADPARVAAALEGGRFEGLAGPLSFDAEGDALRDLKILELDEYGYRVLP